MHKGAAAATTAHHERAAPHCRSDAVAAAATAATFQPPIVEMRNFFSVCLFQSDYVDKVGIGMTLIITIIYLPSLMMMRCTTLPQIAACPPHALPNLSAAVARRRRAATARYGNIPTQSRRKV